MDIIHKAIEMSKDYIEDPSLDKENIVLNMDLPEKPDVSWYTTYFSAKKLQKISKRVRRLSIEEEKALFLRYNLARKHIKQLHASMENAENEVPFRLAIKKWYNTAIECRQLLAEYNLALVISGMKSFLKAGLNFDDLLSEGNTALLKAINRFDVSTGNKFSTYATYAIRNALIHELNEHKKRYEKFPVSLDPSLGNGENEEKNVVDEHHDDQEQYLIELLKQVLKKNTVRLNDVERQVVELRYLSGHNKTYVEIGNAIGISREWARHHDHNALAKLRKFFEQHA